MLEILLFAAVVSLVNCDECAFSQDCGKVARCQGIQDAGCACRFGSCAIVGNPFFRGSECDTWKDCNCKNKPDICFCRNGFCQDNPQEKFECHTKADCKKLAKCKNKDCACSDDLCEYQCSSKEQCIREKYHCSEVTGYTCKCENSLCRFENLPKECDNIRDCVRKGKCTRDKPCSCTNNQCTDPWFTSTPGYPVKNCRRAEDCDFHLLMCQKGKCTCENKTKVGSSFETWGECVLKKQ